MNETNEKMLAAYGEVAVAQRALAMTMLDPLLDFKGQLAKAERQALDLLDRGARQIWQNEAHAKEQIAAFKARGYSTLYLMQTVAESPSKFGKLKRDGVFLRSYGKARLVAQDLLRTYQSNVLMTSLQTVKAVPAILELNEELLRAVNGLRQRMEEVHGEEKVFGTISVYEERAIRRRKAAEAKVDAKAARVPFDPCEPENHLPHA